MTDAPRPHHHDTVARLAVTGQNFGVLLQRVNGVFSEVPIFEEVARKLGFIDEYQKVVAQINEFISK